MVAENKEPDLELDLATAIGAAGESAQVLALFIPDKDRSGKEIGDQRRWVLGAATLLTHMGGGATIMPPSEGAWLDFEDAPIVWERPVVVFSYIVTESFVARLPELRDFLHALGRETGQGEVVMVFDGVLYRIRQFDPPQPRAGKE